MITLVTIGFMIEGDGLEGKQIVYMEEVFKPFEIGEISSQYFEKPLSTWGVTAIVPLELNNRRFIAEFRTSPYFLRKRNAVCLFNPEWGYQITKEDLTTHEARVAKLDMDRWNEFIAPNKTSLVFMTILKAPELEFTSLSRLKLQLDSPGGRFQSSAYGIVPDRTLSFYYFHPLDTKPLASLGDDLVPNGVRLSIPIVNDTESLENLIKRLEDITTRFTFR